MSRRGAKKDPHYRVVVSDQKSPRDGRFVEIVGYYNPALRPVRLNLKLDRVDYWLGQGAQPTETVRTLIRRVQNAEPEAVEVPKAAPEPVGEEVKAAKAEKVEETIADETPPAEQEKVAEAEEAAEEAK